MTASDSQRLPDPEWAEESSLDWYFDLPSGAWERQEKKNRELRDRLRQQAREVPPKRPVAFSVRDHDPLGFEEVLDDMQHGAEGVGAARNMPETHTTRLQRAPRNALADIEPGPAEADTPPAPMIDLDLGVDDAVSAADAGVEHPATLPIENEEYDDEPPPSAEGEDVADTVVPEAVETPGEHAQDAVARPMSRWDEMLAAHAEESSIVEGMRAWAAASSSTRHERASVSESESHASPTDAFDMRTDEALEAEVLGAETPVRRRGLVARLFRRRGPSGAAPTDMLVDDAEAEWALDEGDEADPDAAVAEDDEIVEVKAEGVDESAPADDAEPDEDVLLAAATLLRRVRDAGGFEQDGGMTDMHPRPDDDTIDEEAERQEPALPAEPPPQPGAGGDDDPWAEFIAARDSGLAMPRAAGGEDAEQAFPFAEGSSGSNSGQEAVPAEPIAFEPLSRQPGWLANDETAADATAVETSEAAALAGGDDELSWEAIVNASGVHEASQEPILPPGIQRPGRVGRGAVIGGMAGDEWDSPGTPGGETTSPEALDPEPDVPEEPAWVADNASDDDIVVRAFEEHAAEAGKVDEPPERHWVEDPHAAADLSDLLGDDHESLIGGPAPFAASLEGNPRGWAPQRAIEIGGPDAPPTRAGGEGQGDGAPPTFAPWETPFDDAGDSGRPQTPVEQRRPWVRELIETGLLAILVFLAVRASFQNFRVDGLSMYPTLDNGQYIIVNKLSYSQINLDRMSDFVPFVNADEGEERYLFGGPQRGDIIVFQSPRNPSEDLIKRVIGLPNETIEIRDGHVYLNDRLLEEPYIEERWTGDKPKVLIPPGQYFVMGDNRNNSQDSRSSQVGLVPESLIIGKAALSYLPLDKFGLAPNGGGELSDEPVLTTQRIDD